MRNFQSQIVGSLSSYFKVRIESSFRFESQPDFTLSNFDFKEVKILFALALQNVEFQLLILLICEDRSQLVFPHVVWKNVNKEKCYLFLQLQETPLFEQTIVLNKYMTDKILCRIINRLVNIVTVNIDLWNRHCEYHWRFLKFEGHFSEGKTDLVISISDRVKNLLKH